MSEELYKVKKILDKKYSSADEKWLYLVKWDGYDTDESTWEPEDNLCYIPAKLSKFNQKWQAKKLLHKEKQKTKLQKLAESQRIRSKNLKKQQRSIHEEVVKANLALDVIDEDNIIENPPLIQESLAFKPQTVEGILGKDTISRILGIREYEGVHYFAVLFKSSQSRLPRASTFPLSTLEPSAKPLMMAYLLSKLGNNQHYL